MKICKRCNSEFNPNSNRQIYCGSIKEESGCSWENRKERKRRYSQEFRKNNSNYCKEYCRKWYLENKKYLREYQRKYYQLNKERHNERSRELYRKSPKFRLSHNITTAIGKALKGKKAGKKWETLVGYTLQDLIKHLENLFKPWMNWDNYGKWEIDHIKPQSLFKYNRPEDKEFKKCWALENLQPMKKIANMVKGNRYEKNEQKPKYY